MTVWRVPYDFFGVEYLRVFPNGSYSRWPFKSFLTTHCCTRLSGVDPSPLPFDSSTDQLGARKKNLCHDGVFFCPKNPDPSKVANLRTRTLAIQVQTLPLEGPRILRVGCFKMCLAAFNLICDGRCLM